MGKKFKKKMLKTYLINDNKLNICQVTLKENIPIILENYKRFKKIYGKINIFIICPKKDVLFFKKKLNFEEFHHISEDEILSFQIFQKIFIKTSKNYKFKKNFKKRLSWYYQQILKLSFCFFFISKFQKSLLLWDADTIITKKISFVEGTRSTYFGTFNEFHESYFKTNKKLLGTLPKYFISSVVQFAHITATENSKMMKKLRVKKSNINVIAKFISKLIFEKIFQNNKYYNGSLFSEYEFIGNSNQISYPKIQKLIATVRKGLSGRFNKVQLNLLGMLNISNVTYEHTYKNKTSEGMLNRSVKWPNFIIIVIKTLSKFYYNFIKHICFYILNFIK